MISSVLVFLTTLLIQAQGQYYFSTTIETNTNPNSFVTFAAAGDEGFYVAQSNGLYKIGFDGYLSQIWSPPAGYQDGKLEDARFWSFAALQYLNNSLYVMENDDTSSGRLRKIENGIVSTVNVSFSGPVDNHGFNIVGNTIYFLRPAVGIKTVPIENGTVVNLINGSSPKYPRGLPNGRVAYTDGGTIRVASQSTQFFSFLYSFFDVDSDGNIYTVSTTSASVININGVQSTITGYGDVNGSLTLPNAVNFVSYSKNGVFTAIGQRNANYVTSPFFIVQYFPYSTYVDPVLISGTNSFSGNLMANTPVSISMPCQESNGTPVEMGMIFGKTTKAYLNQASTRINSVCNNNNAIFSDFKIYSSTVVRFYVVTKITKKFQSISKEIIVELFIPQIPPQQLGYKTDATFFIKGCDDCNLFSLNILSKTNTTISGTPCVNNTINLSNIYLFASDGPSQIQHKCSTNGVVSASNLFNVSRCPKLEYLSVDIFKGQCLSCPQGTFQDSISQCRFCPSGQVLSIQSESCELCQSNCNYPFYDVLSPEDFEYFLTEKVIETKSSSFLPDNSQKTLIAFCVLAGIFALALFFAIVIVVYSTKFEKSSISILFKRADVFFRRSKAVSHIEKNGLNKVYIPSASGGVVSILYITAAICTVLGLVVDFSLVSLVLTPNTSEAALTFSVPLTFRLRLWFIGQIQSQKPIVEVDGISGNYEITSSSNYSGFLNQAEINCVACSLSLSTSIQIQFIGSYFSALSWDLKIDTPFTDQPGYYAHYGIHPPAENDGLPRLIFADNIYIYPSLSVTDILYQDGSSVIGYTTLPSQSPLFKKTETYVNTTFTNFPKAFITNIEIVTPSQVNRYQVVRTKNVFVLITQCVSVMGGLFFVFKVVHKTIIRYIPLSFDYEMKEI